VLFSLGPGERGVWNVRSRRNQTSLGSVIANPPKVELTDRGCSLVHFIRRHFGGVRRNYEFTVPAELMVSYDN
jgi:hypothetical protein